MTDQNTFEDELRLALNHLYAPADLRKSPLVAALGLQGNANTAAALRDILLAAIEALKPAAGAPAASGQAYQVLYYRYVQRLTQQDVANQLGLSPRHLRRVQDAALATLAGSLRDRYGVLHEGAAQVVPVTANVSTEAAVDRELLSLGDRLGDACAAVEPVVREALELVAGLAARQRVTLATAGLPPTMAAALPGMVLKEIILNLLTAAIQGMPGGCVEIGATRRGQTVLLDVEARAAKNAGGPGGGWDADSVGMARRLAELCQGRLEAMVASDGACWRANVVLPAGELVTVLAIEDNADTLQLWERYLQDSRFSLVGETDPQLAVATAEQVRPAVIVLDLMMPGVDGWKLLAQLRNHPIVGNTPIVICSVLPQKELALSLGASDFIRKPASREAFQAVLQRQIEAAERP